MTEAEKYQGYSWIKVKRSKPIDVDGVPHVPEAHHVEETTFLIDEIRKLAARIDALNATQARLLTTQTPIYHRDYHEQSDYLPYEDDGREGG